MSGRIDTERGAVALLTTIIISILLTIITTGLITLMISEVRQANDAEQSVRAYYAAQSGVEDGIRKVINDLSSGSTAPRYCGSGSSQYTDLDPSNPGTVGWTCQQITYSGSPTGSLPVADKAAQIDIGTVPANANSMVISWDTTPTPGANFYNAPAGNFPAAGGWSYAAVLEAAMIDYPAGSFSASTPGQILMRNALMVPHNPGGTFTYDYSTIKAGAGGGINPMTGKCSVATAYRCQVVINNPPRGRDMILRLRSRYVGTDYRVEFRSLLGAGGVVVPVPDGEATIDITAKAGDAFRRVVYKVPYTNGAASGLDYVIYSDRDVCKDFATMNGLINPNQTIGCPYN